MPTHILYTGNGGCLEL